MSDSDMMECPRCNGKGEVEEARWDWVHIGNGFRKKVWRDKQVYRCPICYGEGRVPDVSNDGRFVKRETVYWMGDKRGSR